MKDFQNRNWGHFYTLEECYDYKIKILMIGPGEAISLQKHLKRSENWTILLGVATIFLGDNSRSELTDEERIRLGETFQANRGDMIPVDINQWHRITNNGNTNVVILEAQFGECEESDIVRREDKYGRV